MPMLDLGPAAGQVTRLLAGVSDDQLTDPTPCPGTPVAGLLDHFMGLSLAFLWAARKSTPEGGGGPPHADAANLDEDWRTTLPQRLEELAEAWRDPAAWEGMTEAGGVTMPGEAIGAVALDELVMHGWDLARATGQAFACDAASAGAVLAFTSHLAEPEMADAREGLFGPVVDVPADASDFERALGFAGRDPAWTAA
ncbi:MAG: TIGR03086 family metal-binding protein [Pseudonocardiales bacterium]